MISFKTGASIASAAAMLAIAGLTVSAPAYAKHNKSASAQAQPCYGINSCKGTSDCKSGTHDCKGMNDCKGQGFKSLTAKACTKAHGSLTAPAN